MLGAYIFTIVNIYASYRGAPQYIRQVITAIKGETDRNTIIVGDFNIPLTSMDRSSRQKISKKTDVLNDTIDQLDLIDIYKTLHPRKPENTYFFKRTWNIL